MTRLQFRGPDLRRYEISEPIVELFRRHRQHDRGSTEAGGVLIGRTIEPSGDLVADSATEPQPGDVRGRTHFRRSAKGHQESVQAWHEKSGGTASYVGEWHTHPEYEPSPSAIDLADWRRLTKVHRADLSRLLFLIVGTAVIRAWTIGERSVIIPLQPFELT